MTTAFRPAKREAVGLLIGLAGASGSGKTFSALRLASGLAAGKRFALIDTENGRALHYADAFQFDHARLDPPFRPDAYAQKIKDADQAGYPVIVIDSASHEHAGDGGLLDWHEEELQRMAGDDYKRREQSNMAAWVKPKQAHKRMVQQLLRVRAHVILCFRAEEKVEMVRGDDGKWVVRPKRSLTGLDGWVPVCEKSLPYEMTLSALLVPDRPGMPRPIKLQEQHRAFVPLEEQLSEQVGVALAAWAAGGQASAPSNGSGSEDDVASLRARLLELSEQLGARDVTEPKVAQHADANAASPEKHVTWLRGQITRAERRLEELAVAGALPFGEDAS